MAVFNTLRPALVAAAFTLFAAHPRAAEPAERAVAAKATSPAATFAARQPGSDGFKTLPGDADLFTGDLLVTLPGASLTGKNGAVALKSLADYDGKSPLPTLETALTLNDPKDADLDFTFDRGRVELSNVKADGAAVARVRFWGEVWTVTLDAPGSRVALELCGRWPSGARFRPLEKGTTEKPAEPVASLALLVVKGSASANIGGVTLGLNAPPGPAYLEWDSLAGARPQPLKLEKLPDWADPGVPVSADGQRAAAAVEKFRQARADDPAAALRAFAASADPFEQRVALVTVGATDDLDAIGRLLGGAKTPVAWDFGVTVLRHWLGRCPGQDQRLYDLLVSPAIGYTAPHARTILQLLFGFDPADLRQPETYEVLIEYLTHDQAAIRNLAAWHLVRLDPRGKGVAYKPGGTKDDCTATAREWKKLIPAGQLPPQPGKKD